MTVNPKYLLPVFLAAILSLVSGCGEADSPNPTGRLPSLSSAEASELGDELVDQNGGFAYRMPRGWSAVNSRSGKYLVASGRTLLGFAPNIATSRERAPVRFDGYAERSKHSIGKLMPGATLQEECSFTTTAGLKGRRWIVFSESDGQKLWHAFYLFPGEGDDKFMLTASHTRDGGPRMLFAFDGAMKTFRIH